MGVFVGVKVAVDVLVMVAVGVLVGVSVGSGVLVGVLVAAGAGVSVGVNVGVAVGGLVGVAVGVGVFVGVGVGTEAKVNTSCGGGLPSREVKVTPFVLSGRSTKLYVPLPVIWAVTLYSAQVLAVIAATLAIAPLVGAGRLFQVRPVSVQVLSVR